MRNHARDHSTASSFDDERQRMVELQLRGRDITHPGVLQAMRSVPRHVFLPAELQHRAYEDRPIPIFHNQTMSQPYVVAVMSQIGMQTQAKRALDVGTGSGYQAAILGELVDEVYSVEIVEDLARSAQVKLAAQGYHNVHVRCSDGYHGWPEQGPFDVIIVAAAPGHIPQPLVDQLAPGGKLIIPVGHIHQDLMVITRLEDGRTENSQVFPVTFVPMTGDAERR